jgi:aspartyl-tRNA(Asn)/glutamyl-tRNA(Gln) amidotransferase subunit C
LKITTDQVRYVADLANLRLTDDEVDRMAREMDEILTHIDKLNELDTSAVEPMAQVLYDAAEGTTMRPDTEHQPLGQAAALANAPMAGNGCFKVPKVIER